MDPWDFAEFINDYHDLLLSPPAESEDDETDVDKNSTFLSAEVAKVSTGMSPEVFIDLTENDKE